MTSTPPRASASKSSLGMQPISNVRCFPRIDPWSVRAVQLDLARQMETVDRIIEFAQLAYNEGFNTLFLYLEGRIKTPCFPFREDSVSYAPADMRRIVEACASWGMEVVPCVPTLGHVEQFLTCEAIKGLANDATKNGTTPSVYDTTNEAVYQFLESYLREVSAVFPSEHVHIGCDEAWLMGQSSGERARRQAGGTYADIFIDHIHRMRAILLSLGKRAWIWDDHLEYFTDEEVARIPRDVVMCAWHYCGDQIEKDGVRGHFNNLHRRDWLKLYDSLGIDVLIAPAVGYPSSIEPITRWTQGHRVAGGLLTLWELSRSQLPYSWFATKVTGAMWREVNEGKGALGGLPFEQRCARAIQELLPNASRQTHQAIKSMIEQPWICRDSVLASQLISHPFDETKQYVLEAATTVCQIIQAQSTERFSGPEGDLFEEYALLARNRVLTGRMHRLLSELIDPRLEAPLRVDGQGELTWIREEIRSLREARAQSSYRWRPDVQDQAAAEYGRMEQDFEATVGLCTHTPQPRKLMLVMELFLWECFSAPYLNVQLQTPAGQWIGVTEGNYKPQDYCRSHYTRRQLIDWDYADPIGIRIMGGGFGGQGIAFARLIFHDRRLVPEQIISREGAVENADHLLREDLSVCYLGNPNTPEALINHTRRLTGTITLSLGKASNPASSLSETIEPSQLEDDVGSPIASPHR